MAEAHHSERGSFVTIDHPGAGPMLQPGAPIPHERHALGEPSRADAWGGTTVQRGLNGWIGSRTTNRLYDGAETSNPQSIIGNPKPLSGVRVIDFTNAVAGPIASFILADLGAEVIKIEAPTSRPKVTPPAPRPSMEGADAPCYNRIMLFNELNHGKRSFALDVAQPAGRELFLELVAQIRCRRPELRTPRDGEPWHRLRRSFAAVNPAHHARLDARLRALRPAIATASPTDPASTR